MKFFMGGKMFGNHYHAGKGPNKDGHDKDKLEGLVRRLVARVTDIEYGMRAENRHLRTRVEDLEDIVARHLETPSEYRRRRVREEKLLIQRAEEVIRKQRAGE